jgi:hypothetical protein
VKRERGDRLPLIAPMDKGATLNHRRPVKREMGRG